MFKESIYRGVYVTEVSLLQMSMLQRFSYYRGVHITRESIQVSMSEKCSCYRGTGYPSNLKGSCFTFGTHLVITLSFAFYFKPS